MVKPDSIDRYEDSLVTAIDSFYLHKPTRDNCEALENPIVYTITHSQLETLLNNEKGQN